MRLCSFDHQGGLRAGLVLRDGSVADLTAMAGQDDRVSPTVLEWVLRGREGRTVLDGLLEEASTARYALAVPEASLRAPIPTLPRNVICVGANYTDHIDESERVVGALDLPDAPVYFTKDVRSVCGPRDDIPVDAATTTQLDWEVELAVVIGEPGRDIPVARALDYVWGYTILNDVSARDIQLSRNQWWKGKSLEGSSPMGPYLVSADEIGDPQALELSCWVDHEKMQHASTSQMIHSVASIIADLSTTLTLLPGDVISTGTPSGVGLACTPQQWLTPGRVVEAEITGLGRQTNIIKKEGPADG
jgi:2-keto-4-pentenoate hydratase/2-oxohepta-3-ene-1,7-dioic acid hydratase (catechol pathway)